MKHSGRGPTSFILKTVAVVIGLYLCTSYFSMSSRLADAQAEYEALRVTHAVEQQKTAELEDLVEEGMTDRYIISIVSLHSLLFFSFEHLSFSNFGFFLARFVCSTIATLCLVYLMLVIFIPKLTAKK